MKKLLLLLALATLAIAVAKKARERQMAEWHGLTESEVRSRLDAKLPDRVPEDKRGHIADKVVSEMRRRGVIVDDADTTTDESATVDLRDGIDADTDADIDTEQASV